MPEKIHFDVFSIISLFAFVILFLLAFAILTKKVKRRLPNIFLSLALVFFALSQFNIGILFYTGLFPFFPHTYDISFLFIVEICPLLYLYIKSLKDPLFRLHAKLLWHLLPCLVIGIIKTPIYLLSSADKQALLQSWLTSRPSVNFQIQGYGAAALVVIISCAYIVAIVRMSLPRTKTKGEKAQMTYLNRWILSHIQNAIFMFSLILLTIIGCSLFGADLNFFFRLLPIVVSIIGFLLAAKGLTFPETLCEPELERLSGTPCDEEKYKNIAMSDHQAFQYFEKMRSFLENEELFLNPKLNVQTMAERLKIPRTYVSYLVSRFSRKNFYDFINDYRLAHAQKLLKTVSVNDLKIIDIVFESGFNSKSTFYTFFKNRTGQTPQEYVNDMKRFSKEQPPPLLH